MRASYAAPALVLAAVLGACGGSGGERGTTAARPATVATRAAAPPTASASPATTPAHPRPRRHLRATRPPATARTVPTTATTLTTPPPVKTVTRVPAPTATTPAPTKPPKPGPAPAGHYAGAGSVRLGTFTVRRQTVLRWTSTGRRFRIIYEGSAVALDSRARSGRIVVPAMTFPAIRVVTDGRWTITVGG